MTSRVISTLTNLRSLEDTMNASGFGSERVMGTRQDTMQNQNADLRFSPRVELLESMSTQPESLILAQSERWRQA